MQNLVLETDEAADHNRVYLKMYRSGDPLPFGSCFLSTDELITRNKLSVWAVLVEEQFRGQGLGKALMQQVLEYAEKVSGADSLWLQVFTDNKTAIALYERLGFKITNKYGYYFQMEVPLKRKSAEAGGAAHGSTVKQLQSIPSYTRQ